MSILKRIKKIVGREILMFTHRPIFLFSIIIIPILTIVFFTTLMNDGLPTKIPAGIVDMDNTHITRTITRTLGSMEETEIVSHYSNFSEAQKAMLNGEIFAFFYIPNGTTINALSNKQPKISFYTNDSYFVPGTLLMKDLRYASELTGLAITRETLYAKGKTEKQAMGIIQPIVIETHPLNNSYLNYSVYLNNIIIPGILILIIMLSAAYSIGYEWKMGTQKEWYDLADNSSAIALTGKLLPQTLLFCLIFIFMDIILYKFLAFPCNCSFFIMVLLGVLTVLASQAFAIFLFGLFTGQMRLSLCLCSLWGILSFSIAGFTYPVSAMDPTLQNIAILFPLRHYYLIYVNQALNGHPLVYVWPAIAELFAFLLLPLLVVKRYQYAALNIKYKP